jgi:selenocysteine lyase/cysteine desulfurase
MGRQLQGYLASVSLADVLSGKLRRGRVGGRVTVYLDYNATAPVRPEAKAAVVRALEIGGNPSSVHAAGRAARSLIEAARAQVAAT